MMPTEPVCALATPGAAEAALTPTDLADLLTAFNDVTARLQSSHDRLHAEVARLQQELGQANHQLERSRRLAALGEMAAGIAHEIRNPLGSIALYARMLDEDLADRPTERDTARKIGRAVRGLEAIVQDVLAFSRELRIKAEPVDLRDLLDSSLEASLASLAPEGLTIERLDRRRRATWAICDEHLMRQALVNVIRNALEAMREAPPPHRLSLDVRRSGRTISLLIADTGPGLSPDVLDRIFNPFFTTRHTGTGLGLAIVHRIMDAHRGAIRVRNNDDRGATVELVLPVAPLQEDSAGMRFRRSELDIAGTFPAQAGAERAA
ncbi:MAG: hypothetical protein KF866_12475 [Phycisphaeraceae bacterium]|nr:hypothetical protein [Phycisphaeraceae bacterium]